MNDAVLYPRFAASVLQEALADTPVVLLHGPRQSGKTTLARTLCQTMGYEYVTLDDVTVCEAANSDPVGFVGALSQPIVLDEVQRAPGIFVALKKVVDERPEPGRFLLTGSANVLLAPTLSDSLAGRMEIVRLHPLAQCELSGTAPSFLRGLLANEFPLGRFSRPGEGLVERLVAGGYAPALLRKAARRRRAWYQSYIATLVERDIRDLARIRSLDAIPRLLSMAAERTARLTNISDLAGPFQLTRPTIREYLTLLERIFLVEELPAWHSSRTRRLVKSPKLHVGDTGVACAILEYDANDLEADRGRLGPLLETFVFQELRCQATWFESDLRFYHFRDKGGAEVDIVLERGLSQVAGVEVKASATVTSSDFRGLRKLEELCGDKFASGVVLYDGESCVRFGPKLAAVPIRLLWDHGN